MKILIALGLVFISGWIWDFSSRRQTEIILTMLALLGGFTAIWIGYWSRSRAKREQWVEKLFGDAFEGRVFPHTAPVIAVDTKEQKLHLAQSENEVSILPFSEVRQWQAHWETVYRNKQRFEVQCRVEIQTSNVMKPMHTIWCNSSAQANEICAVLSAALNE